MNSVNELILSASLILFIDDVSLALAALKLELNIGSAEKSHNRRNDVT
ncbi:MAG: hypothetical protein HYY49_04755 [Ignavibacteriales bacterium]|nr:hypothetical protein [Ignavibacteriales bacterium]